ncbi:hypothetical protein [Rhodococcus tukisamuensis]|uniref:Uncharacterized protein n=1 Tax=Rhodococcus tukisamuensis TaxID=168276 RepID=A0A1G6MK61_9NOCA|nr:hypothetical protein [Rhodococcus tukisamuensis]SDC55922.1 hypothetical protein SAMN05444580_101212 [Rhodococcus tukisamuensis]
MKNHWGNRALAVLVAGSLIGTVAACASGDDAEQGKLAGDVALDGLPKAPPVKLPAAWDGMAGGLFQFTSVHPTYTENGILTVSPVDEPVIWSWDGRATTLKPKTDADKIEIDDSLVVARDGKWYPVTVWRGTKNAAGLGEAVTTSYVTTWNEQGESIFQGEVDLGVQLENRGWRGIDGMLVHEVSLNEKFRSSAHTVVLDPMTGKVSRGAMPEDYPTVRAEDGLSRTNPALTIVHPTPDAPGRITNTKTGKVTEMPVENPCGDPIASSVVSSFDGRYLAIGKRVIDTKTDAATCLDPAGTPSLTAITSDGVGYGRGKRNGSDVTISYDFAKKTIAILPEAMVAPSFVGPDDVAVVAPPLGKQDLTGVYRTAT